MRQTTVRNVLVLALAALGLTSAFMSKRATSQQQDPLADPFRGITTKGTIRPELFPIRATGVSTAPIQSAATAFLAGLTAEQKTKATFKIDDVQWRRWNNVHRAAREGVSFEEMNEAQRALASGLLRASLSAKGLRETRDVMRLNGHLADLLNKHGEYGEHLYWLAIMGEPSSGEPWGWQLEGHHLIINYFVLGDQAYAGLRGHPRDRVHAASARSAAQSYRRIRGQHA